VRDFILAKLGHTLIVVFCVLTLVFVVLHLTGDPVMMLLPSNASRERRRVRRWRNKPPISGHASPTQFAIASSKAR